jgi:hypothetical protein
MWFVFLSVTSTVIHAQPGNTVEDGVSLTIADAYIEMHTGPGDSYPVFHVLDRGQQIVVLKRKTRWYKIRSADQGPDQKIGWVSKQQLEQTLLPTGQQLQLAEEDQDDFVKRQWELGVTSGQLEGAPILSIYGGYLFTENVSAELTLGHSVASVSSSNMAKLNLLMQPFPEWSFSPYFTLGAGAIWVKPNATLIEPADKNNAISQVGIGMKTYLSRQFIFRLEYNQYIIFSANNDKDENEDIGEWKLGFAIFF